MSGRRRVLIIPSWYPSAADPTAGVFIAQQVEALRAIVEVAVLHVSSGTTSEAPTVTDEAGVTVVRGSHAGTGLYSRYFGYRRAGRAAFEALREEWGMPDIVHVQALWPAGLIARDLKRRHGLPYVVTEHSEEYSAASERRLVKTPGMLPLILRPLARGASKTIAVSRFLGDRLAALGLARDLVVIPNVVPVSPAAEPSMKLPHVIAHVSVMGPAKNLPVLLRAIGTLQKRRSDFVLRLVGDGECRAEAEALAASLGLGDVVEFTGRRSPGEVIGVLAEAAFTVVSSTHETFSVVAAESLMVGRPVLSTRCGGPEEFITAEVGILVDSGDVAALADGLDWMLDHYADFDAKALHDYAVARFAPPVVAGRILEVYREVLDA